jgi:hypothetical protein
MSLLAALVLVITPARVEAVALTTAGSGVAVRVAVSGEPGTVAVHRDGGTARVSLSGTRLGGPLAGGGHFAWTPILSDPAVRDNPVPLDRIDVVAGRNEVSVLLRVPPDVSIDVRRGPAAFLLVFREAPDEVSSATAHAPRRTTATPAPQPFDVETLPESRPPARVETLSGPAHELAQAEPTPEPGPPAEHEPPAPAAPQPAPVEPLPETESPAPATPSPSTAEPQSAEPQPTKPQTADPGEDEPTTEPPSTAELARSLFPDEPGRAAEQASVSELYPQLFPGGPPQTAPEIAEPEGEPTSAAAGAPLGPFFVRAGVEARYVDADTFIQGPDSRTRARYLEVAPRVSAETVLGDGRLSLEYLPSLRAFSNIEEIDSDSHRLRAAVETPLGPSVTVRVQDSFVSGVLDTREVDPGGEYFYELARFHRNTLDGGLSLLVKPRLSVELAGGTSLLRFQEESSFFDYDRRFLSGGLGYELTPSLKTTLLYSYDTVPTPPDRPEAAYRAHNAQLTLTGYILPLISGRLMLGYRDQRSPNAGAGGTRYTGLTMGGSLTKQFSPEADVTLHLHRSTPVSAFEDNAFYVTTSVQAAGRFPLPLELQLQGGMGYQWNDYRTVAEGTNAPREDRIFGYNLGLRRVVVGQLFLSAMYRREERRSNLERFDTDSDGFYVQLEWDIFGNTP